jgi:hypothetical protein
VANRSSQNGASVGTIAADSPSRLTNPHTANSTPTSSSAASAAKRIPRIASTSPIAAETAAISGNTTQIGLGSVALGSEAYCTAPTTTASRTSGMLAAIGGKRPPRENQAPTATTSPAPTPAHIASGDGSGCHVLMTVTSIVSPSTTIGITASRIWSPSPRPNGRALCIQCARWSCHAQEPPVATCSQIGSASASAPGGTPSVPYRSALRYVAGEFRFSSTTPSGRNHR